MSGHEQESGPRAEFARRLRALRDERGLTLRELAARSGYSLASMSIAESGRRVPSWAVVAAFVQSCGRDPQQWRQLWEVARASAGPVEKPSRAPDVVEATEELGSAPAEPALPSPGPGRQRRVLLLGTLATLVVGAVIAVLSISPVSGHTSSSSAHSYVAVDAGPAPPVHSSGTATIGPGEYLDLDAFAPSWNKGVAPDLPAHDLTFSAALRTLLSENAPALGLLRAGAGHGYSDCLGASYGQPLEAPAIVAGLGLCVTTQAGRRALIVVTDVHRDAGDRPDRLVLRITVWESSPDAAYPPVPPHSTYDRYACVGGAVADSVTLRPGDPRAAGWYSSRPTPWGAPQCADQIWWLPYVNGGMNPPGSFSWIFSTSVPGAVTCTLWAYYPPPPSGHSGGTAHYSINDGSYPSGAQLKYLTVAQTDFWGTWHGLGTYTFASGHISVTLDNSGTHVNSQQGVIAGPMHAVCR